MSVVVERDRSDANSAVGLQNGEERAESEAAHARHAEAADAVRRACDLASEGKSDRIADGFVYVVVGVDDTDDLTRSVSTGAVSQEIARKVAGLGGFIRLDITRHQLLLRDDVPYTSHNSAMVFEAFLPKENVDRLLEEAAEVIERRSAPSADPGLCLAVFPCVGRCSEANEAAVRNLIEFGRRAKVEFCSIESAYALAGSIPWVSLTSHGGDESGVVGALAGVGLRLSGNDGRFRGKWKLGSRYARAGESGAAVPRSLTAGELTARLSEELNGAVRMIDREGEDIAASIPVDLQAEAKPVYSGGALCVMCDVLEGVAHPCTKANLGEVGSEEGTAFKGCDLFEWDNDVEECEGTDRVCRNCLNRRWTEDGMACVKGCEIVANGSVV